MKKGLIVILLTAMLCGCVSEEPSTEPLSEPENDTVYSPVLFVDKTNHDDRAYVLGVYKGNEWTLPEEYRYSDKTYESYLGQDTTAVTCEFLTASQDVTFYDHQGNASNTAIQDISCTGAGRVIDETVEIHASFSTPLSLSDRWLIGTYSNYNIFPSDITFSEQSISVDLNNDGVYDTVWWTFADEKTESNSDIGVFAGVDNQTYVLMKETSRPVSKENMRVFVVDLNHDGIQEIAVYTQTMSKFGAVSIYAFENDEYALLTQYAIDAEP